MKLRFLFEKYALLFLAGISAPAYSKSNEMNDFISLQYVNRDIDDLNLDRFGGYSRDVEFAGFVMEGRLAVYDKWLWEVDFSKFDSDSLNFLYYHRGAAGDIGISPQPENAIAAEDKLKFFPEAQRISTFFGREIYYGRMGAIKFFVGYTRISAEVKYTGEVIFYGASGEVLVSPIEPSFGGYDVSESAAALRLEYFSKLGEKFFLSGRIEHIFLDDPSTNMRGLLSYGVLDNVHLIFSAEVAIDEMQLGAGVKFFY